MTETNINLGCAKINIKRDTHHYAPWHVINPQLFNPIPQDAKTYKLSPSTTLFFKMTCCSNLNFGWRQIKTKPKPKEKNMYKSENGSARKSMTFWQKTAVFLVEADHDITHFFDDKRDPRYYQYNPYASTPGKKLTESFQKQNRMEKKDRNTFLMNLGEAWDTFIIRLRDDGSREAKKRANGMRAARRKSNTAFFQKKRKKLSAKRNTFMGNMGNMEAMEIAEEESIRRGIQHVFKPRQTRTLVPQQERLPVIIENVIPNETIVPNAPPIVQPERNPEYKEGTTINNYNFNITCGIS